MGALTKEQRDKFRADGVLVFYVSRAFALAQFVCFIDQVIDWLAVDRCGD